MSIVKKRNEQTQTRLLLEDNEPVELPPAEVEASAVVAQFETFKPFIPELLDALRAGTLAETVPVMMDGSTFAIHGATRTFWVKLWHTNEDLTRVDRVQIISCLPLTRGVRVVTEGLMDDDEYDEDEDEYDDYDDEDNDEDLIDDESEVEEVKKMIDDSDAVNEQREQRGD